MALVRPVRRATTRVGIPGGGRSRSRRNTGRPGTGTVASTAGKPESGGSARGDPVAPGRKVRGRSAAPHRLERDAGQSPRLPRPSEIEKDSQSTRGTNMNDSD